jgi:LmbE family N-acetylglucosaminyl deacetylase
MEAANTYGFRMPRTAPPVDVTKTFQRKIAALREHKSQTAHLTDLEERLRGWLGANASRAGLPDGSLAEAFQVLIIP